MPQNQLQRMAFAFLTVIITVPAFVFYSVYVVNGSLLMAQTQAGSVLEAIRVQGGIYTFGHMLPIWLVMLLEFVCAYTLEIFVGSPTSFKLACKIFHPGKNHPMHFESAIICATVGIMCPAMSFLATIFYYPYYDGFTLLSFLARWVALVCHNFPFAFFSQMFFIQPFVRTLFGILFRKQIAQAEKNKPAQEELPTGETDVILDILRRIEALDQDIGNVNQKRKQLESRMDERISTLDRDIGNVNRKRKELKHQVEEYMDKKESDDS